MGKSPTVNPFMARAPFPGLLWAVNSNKILQTGGELVSARTPGQANPSNCLSAEVLTMEVTIAKEVLKVVGFAELTAANSHQFRKKVCAALNGQTVVEIDLSQTTFIDSAGLGALFAVHILTRRRNGVVRLVNPTPPVQQVLDLVRAGHIFEIVHTRPRPSWFASR